MPNWCKNEWDIRASTKEQAEHVRNLLMTSEGGMTFEGFAPMPEVLRYTLAGTGRDVDGNQVEEGKRAFPSARPGDDGFGVYRPFTEEEEKALAAPECNGHRDWYAWCSNVWGVKWGPSEVEVVPRGREGPDVQGTLGPLGRVPDPVGSPRSRSRQAPVGSREGIRGGGR